MRMAQASSPMKCGRARSRVLLLALAKALPLLLVVRRHVPREFARHGRSTESMLQRRRVGAEVPARDRFTFALDSPGNTAADWSARPGAGLRQPPAHGR